MIVCPGGAAPQAISTNIIIRPYHLLHLIFWWLVALSGRGDYHYDDPAALAFVILTTAIRIIIVVMGTIIIAMIESREFLLTSYSIHCYATARYCPRPLSLSWLI